MIASTIEMILFRFYVIIVERTCIIVPLKIKKLKAALSKAGFYSRSAKGSHTMWKHPAFPELRVALSGRDAQQYQIDDVRDALRKVGKDL